MQVFSLFARVHCRIKATKATTYQNPIAAPSKYDPTQAKLWLRLFRTAKSLW
jgi:hypothetical protein